MRSTESDTVALFGLPITNVNMEQAVARVEAYILSGKTHQIATANLDFARNSLRDPYLHHIICECSMVLPDGAPMLWASRLLGSPLRQRVTGVDLIPELARLSEEKGYGIFMLGASEQSSERAAKALTDEFPGMRLVGRHCPPISPLSEMDHDEVIRCIKDADPEIILVAFGNPKQEIWIHRHKDRLPPAVIIGVGGSLDIIAGTLRRAPAWVRRMQLEWFYRMSQEPRRLLPRYVRDAMALFTHLPLGLAASRMQPMERRQRGSAVEVKLGTRVFATPGKLGARAGGLLVHEARAAARSGETLVIDMSATLRVEAAGVGGLLEARRIMLDEGLWIWLTAMSNPVRRVLQFSAVADLFRVALSPAVAIHATSTQTNARMTLEPATGSLARRMASHPEVKTATAKAS